MKIRFWSFVLALSLLAGCAQIPSQSVELSQGVGTGLEEAHRAYVALVNLYFEQKRGTIDQWIEEKFVPLYISTVEKKLGTNSFDADLTSDIVQRIVKKRDEMHAALDRTRTTVLDKIEANHAILTRANTQLTALLQSASKVRESNSALTGALKDLSGGKVDFQSLDQKLNDYLEKAGAVSQQATGLYEQLQSVVNP